MHIKDKAVSEFEIHLTANFAKLFLKERKELNINELTLRSLRCLCSLCG
jgi:hypothetical protein